MTTRKRAASSKTITGKAIANVDALLQAQLDAIRSKIQAPTGKNIKILRSGEEFEVPGVGIVPAAMRVVVVAFTNRNDFYVGPYDENNIVPPKCFAISDEIKAMAPDVSVSEPEAIDCASCILNQWGSEGKRKACKNQKIVAVLPPDDPNADILLVKVSPTGVKDFDGMVSVGVSRFGKVPVQVIAEIGIKPAGQGYAFTFGLATDENSQPVLNPEVGAFIARAEEAQKIVEARPDMAPKEPPPKTAVRRRTTQRRPRAA